MLNIQIKIICDGSICILIFRSCLLNGKLPTEWKIANAVSARKKGDKKNLKNYREYLYFLLFEKYLKEYCVIKR